METQNFDYLRPPSEALRVTRESNYIQKGERDKSVRKIFYNVPMTPYETTMLTQFEDMIRAEHITLPRWWNRQEALRWCYCQRFDLPKCITFLKTHLEFNEKMLKTPLSTAGEAILKTGAVYQFGRNRQFRPIIIVDVPILVRNHFNFEEFENALCNLLWLIRGKMFLPGYVENWVILIETSEYGLTSLPLKQLKAIVGITQWNFPSFLHKMFILNPAFMVSTGWSVISSLLDPETAGKITMVKTNDLARLQEQIPPDNLEKRFRGQAENLNTFYPPQILPKDKNRPRISNNSQFEDLDFDSKNYSTYDPAEPIKNENFQLIPQIVQPSPAHIPAPVVQTAIPSPAPESVLPPPTVKPVNTSEVVAPKEERQTTPLPEPNHVGPVHSEPNLSLIHI
eukprot:TRINITY_DN6366_c0_g1_i1.p1 TRINITY_DN6366_c0_g1~~TRINITY_DN6366_c0_g1_i1.p1  ORF type:complete len:396 (+),score=65.98 TRINITY_DN6366_c0_g1_i1:115-1302(+)